LPQSNLLKYQIAISKINGIGSITAKALISHCGGIEEVFQAKKKDLTAIAGIGELTADLVLKSEVDQLAEPTLNQLDKNKNIRAYFYTDSEYPKRLTHHDQTPLMLYVDGEVDMNPPRTIAIIGTRNCNEYGSLQCEKLVDGLFNYDVTIISGLAYGIDVIAHRKAVELNIPNIAVLGSGIDVIYPANHAKLAQKIKKNGAIMSQFDFGTAPDRQNFPTRNQVVAAMSDAVVVVQSKKSGGSMITAHMASEMNKDVFALPGRVTDDTSEGCNTLIKRNRAHLMTSAEDIAYIMRWEPREKLHAQLQLFNTLDPSEKVIVDLLKKEETVDIDTMHHILQKPLSTLSAELLALEFKGLVKSLPGKRYSLI